MKIIKILLKIILALIVLVFGISLLFPTDIDVSRSVVVNASVESVYPNVNAMAGWQNWGGPWHEEGMDYNDVIQRFEGAEAGVGSKLIYDQGKGEGSVEIVESEQNQKVKTLITFANNGTANGEWTFEAEGNSTKVTWNIHVALGYNPVMRIMGNLMMAGKVGPLFEIGLNNLKNISEK